MSTQKIKTLAMKAVWYSELGRGKIIARGYGMIPEALMLFTFLKVYGVEVSIPAIAITIILIYIISIGLGYYYAHNGYLEIETSLANKFNPEIQKLLRKK